MTQERSEEQKRFDGLKAERALLKLKHGALVGEIKAIEDRLWAIENPVMGELAAARNALELKKWQDKVMALPPAIWIAPKHYPKGGVYKVTDKQVHIAVFAIPGRIDRISKTSGRLDLKAMGIDP
jgi:hypothetical protein